jgi:predicted membrane protein
MGFVFSGMFWGIVLILLGLSVILRVVFDVDLPVIRIVFAVVLIYLGVRVLVGGSWRVESPRNTVLFAESEVPVTPDDDEYRIVFGRGRFDLTGIVPAGASRSITVETVFGNGVVRVKADAPIRIRASATFGSARLPDGNEVSFGATTWRSPAYREGEPFLDVRANVVFGALQIVTE